MKELDEVWLPVKGYEGSYEVSNIGRVKSMDRFRKARGGKKAFVSGRVLKHRVGSNGYPYICLCKDGSQKSKTIHQLVAIAFLNHIPCGFKLVINHINLVKTDNRVENLEIVSNRINSNQKHIKSSSKYVGVRWDKSNCKWRAYIRVGGKTKHLGMFKNEKVASAIYQYELSLLSTNLS